MNKKVSWCRRSFLASLAAGLMLVAGVLMTNAQAQTAKPTQDDAKALTLKAAEIVKAKGIDEAAKLFNQEGEFKYGEIYVTVIDIKGNWVVYPPKPAAVGNSILGFVDPDGKKIGEDIVAAGMKGEGWVEYRWKNPVSNKIEPKVTFVKKIEGTDYLTYVGIYK